MISKKYLSIKGLAVFTIYIASLFLTEPEYFETIYFYPDEVEIDTSYFGCLKRLVNYMDIYKEDTLVLFGYADIDGSEEYNKMLSLMRAKSVKSSLTELGGDRTRIVSIGKGEKEDPLKKNSRKVEIYIKKNHKSVYNSFKVQNELNITGDILYVFISDYVEIDGDIVTVISNDLILFENLRLNNQKINIPTSQFKKGKNYIGIVAENMGTVGVATPRFKIETSDTTYIFYLSARTNDSAAVVLNLQ